MNIFLIKSYKIKKKLKQLQILKEDTIFKKL